MDIKIMRKYFGIAGFLDEQRFLQGQQSQGWKLVKIQGLWNYYFEKSEEKYIYCLDYKDSDNDDASYLQLYNDCGWEYVLKRGTWYYFRKKSEDILETDKELFSDKQSKLDMLKKVMRRYNLIYILTAIAFSYWVSLGIQNLIYFLITIPMCFIIGVFTAYTLKNFMDIDKLIKELKNPLIKNKGDGLL